VVQSAAGDWQRWKTAWIPEPGGLHPFPTVLDTVASILLFTGLYLSNAFRFQMIRGAALIFAGIFSTMFLNHSLTGRHWPALFVIICGLLGIVSQDVQRVSYDQVTLPYTEHKAILTGDLLIIIAEILNGLQYVYEEKELNTSNVAPLQAAGWQGIFGLAITSILAICMHYLPTVSPFTESSRAVFDDWSDLLEDLKENLPLIIAMIAFTVSCTLYNFIRLSITMYSSRAMRLLSGGIHYLEFLELGHDHGQHFLPEGPFPWHRLEFGEQRCSKQPARGCNLRKLRDFWSAEF